VIVAHVAKRDLLEVSVVYLTSRRYAHFGNTLSA